ncbi:hypothetical protein CTAYLR_002917 [Chrysophaeum taylorii]|uniref:Galactose oxidase n=1 Tax=Chrysophaeum taylorii TaxID=2483200 RepID=A0AAD7UM22_9STRA|nr:hypothetical protein CTAYLR_002917 [Chrysophaeum taylorii]
MGSASGVRWSAAGGATISPPRSGHTAAVDAQGTVWLFGGYAEDGERRVTNDVWKLDGESWERVVLEGGGPGPRLCSASCIVGSRFLLFAGWDPQETGTGGVILDDVWALDLENLAWEKLGTVPRGPVSRHVAVATPRGVVLHTFRCLESVLVFDGNEWTEQPTAGEAPSSRGLHSAALVGDEVVVFGGADKAGDMRADAWGLDTRTWTWRRLAGDSDGPTPRAGSCASSYGTTFLVCCGAERGATGGLVPRSDAWALDVQTGKWTLLIDDPTALRPRNAATLSGPLRHRKSDDDTLVFALHGGWHPFVETFDDTHFLEI